MNDKIAKKTFDVDTCIFCGCDIPEGGHVCNTCLKKYDDENDIALSNNKNKNNRNNRHMLYRKNERKK